MFKGFFKGALKVTYGKRLVYKTYRNSNSQNKKQQRYNTRGSVHPQIESERVSKTTYNRTHSNSKFTKSLVRTAMFLQNSKMRSGWR